MEILLCDDHRLLAELLGTILTGSGHDVTYAATPRAAIEEVASRPIDVCVMDLGFPGDDRSPDHVTPLEAIREISSRGCRVIVLSGSAGSVGHRQVMEAGASDYLLKGDPATSLVHAIEHPDEHRWRSRRYETSRGASSSGAAWNHASLATFLTPRERCVLEGLVRGESTALLAVRLGVRPATARTHVQNLLGKLCVHSRLEAVALAVEHGVVEVADQPA